MVKNLILFESLGSKWSECRHQELWDPDKKQVLFLVSDLCECPEDAIIGRALYDGEDVSSFIETGMRYSREGYSSINLTYVEVPENEDMDEYIEEYLSKWKETLS